MILTAEQIEEFTTIFNLLNLSSINTMITPDVNEKIVKEAGERLLKLYKSITNDGVDIIYCPNCTCVMEDVLFINLGKLEKITSCKNCGTKIYWSVVEERE